MGDKEFQKLFESFLKEQYTQYKLKKGWWHVRKKEDNKMKMQELIGLNTRWYRYQKGLTQEEFAKLTNFKMAYISVIESGNANLTCRNIDVIADALKVDLKLLINEATANKALDLPMRVHMYGRKK